MSLKLGKVVYFLIFLLSFSSCFLEALYDCSRIIRAFDARKIENTMYAICTQHVHNMYTICTQYVLNIYASMNTICTQYVHNMYTICTQYLRKYEHNMYAICTQYVRNIYAIYVHNMYATCTLVCGLYAPTFAKINHSTDLGLALLIYCFYDNFLSTIPILDLVITEITLNLSQLHSCRNRCIYCQPLMHAFFPPKFRNQQS